MDILNQLVDQFVNYRSSLYRDSILDDQFTELLKLQDESNPDFAVEVVSLFFQDAEKLINSTASALEQGPVDFKQIDANVHQLKGSSSSIGAARVKNTCVAFRTYSEAQNFEGCLRCLQQVSHECTLLKSKLDMLFRVSVGTLFLIYATEDFRSGDPRYVCYQAHRVKCMQVKLEQQILTAGGSIPPID